MSDNPHEIFRTQEDYWSWDKYIEQCELINLPDADKQRVEQALRRLRRVLGEGFLRRSHDRRSLLFFWYFTNTTARARLALIELAESLDVFRDAPGFRGVLKRIRKPTDDEEQPEAMSVIAVADRFRKVGFSISFEIAVTATDRHGLAHRRLPDLKIVDEETGEEVFVEVSRLMLGEEQRKIERTYHYIWSQVHNAMWRDPEAMKDVLHSRFILPYALIHRSMNDEELTDATARIGALLDNVRASNEFREFTIEGVIEVCASPYDDHAPARTWAAARGMTDLVEGPLIDTDEVDRAREKLRGKVEQLPDDRPGIVVMTATGNLIFYTNDVRRIAAGLVEEAHRHPRLLCAIILHAFDEGAQEGTTIVEAGRHAFVNKVTERGATEQSLIVFNETCGHPVSDVTWDKIRRAFAGT